VVQTPGALVFPTVRSGRRRPPDVPRRSGQRAAAPSRDRVRGRGGERSRGAGGDRTRRVQVARIIERESRATRTLFLSAYYDQEIVYKALATGAAGYLSKDARGNEIADAVVAVARGETVLGRDIQAAVAQRIRQTAERTGPTLSPREREVLEFVSTGLSSPEVARRLNLSTTTVKTHLQRVYEKLGVGDRAAAVAEAMRQHLLE
jgi:two-component system nitrate/nitrite response regulator NarL